MTQYRRHIFYIGILSYCAIPCIKKKGKNQWILISWIISDSILNWRISKSLTLNLHIPPSKNEYHHILRDILIIESIENQQKPTKNKIKYNEKKHTHAHTQFAGLIFSRIHFYSKFDGIPFQSIEILFCCLFDSNGNLYKWMDEYRNRVAFNFTGEVQQIRKE